MTNDKCDADACQEARVKDRKLKSLNKEMNT